MTNKLQDIGFRRSLMMNAYSTMMTSSSLYILIFAKDGNTLMPIIRQLRNLGLNTDNQGYPADYIGVNIKKTCNGMYKLTQLILIDVIIDDRTR
ncbi:hypothetical protein ACHAW6_000335 [Cyclotella cf. meneghiniana]